MRLIQQSANAVGQTQQTQRQSKAEQPRGLASLLPLLARVARVGPQTKGLADKMAKAIISQHENATEAWKLVNAWLSNPSLLELIANNNLGLKWTPPLEPDEPSAVLLESCWEAAVAEAKALFEGPVASPRRDCHPGLRKVWHKKETKETAESFVLSFLAGLPEACELMRKLGFPLPASTASVQDFRKYHAKLRHAAEGPGSGLKSAASA